MFPTFPPSFLCSHFCCNKWTLNTNLSGVSSFKRGGKTGNSHQTKLLFQRFRVTRIRQDIWFCYVHSSNRSKRRIERVSPTRKHSQTVSLYVWRPTEAQPGRTSLKSCSSLAVSRTVLMLTRSTWWPGGSFFGPPYECFFWPHHSQWCIQYSNLQKWLFVLIWRRAEPS